MSETTDPKEMRSQMVEMMSSKMDQCCSAMDADEIGSMMHDVMPKMMDRCFSETNSEQREGMLGMCRELLDGIEDKYHSRD